MVAKQTARSLSRQGTQHGTQHGKTNEPRSRGSARTAQAMRAAERAPELDGLIHERMRLGIVSALAANESLTFSELKNCLKPQTATSVFTRVNWKTPITSHAPNRSWGECRRRNTA